MIKLLDGGQRERETAFPAFGPGWYGPAITYPQRIRQASNVNV